MQQRLRRHTANEYACARFTTAFSRMREMADVKVDFLRSIFVACACALLTDK